MITSSLFFYYIIAVLALSFMPGPDMIYIISQSLTYGKRYGLAAAFGIASGCFVHIFAVSLGLSSLIFESSYAFQIVKYVGVAYLLYIGLSSLLINKSTLENGIIIPHETSWKKSFRQGFFTNVLNPKVALFFLAFLPQFVSHESQINIGVQLLALGLLFNCIGSSVNICVALCFGAIKQWLSSHPKILRFQKKFTGLLLIGLGLRLAAFDKFNA